MSLFLFGGIENSVRRSFTPHLNIPVLTVNDDKELFIPATPTIPVAHPTTTDYPPTSKVSEFGPTKYFQYTQNIQLALHPPQRKVLI